MSKKNRHMSTKKINHNRLISQLKKIGLNETDAEVYLASIHIWAASIKDLTTHTKLHRITTHDSVWRLIEKWLLLETFSGRKRLIFPQQIDQLQHLVDIKKAEIDTLQQNVTSTIQILQSLHLQSDYLPRITISKWRAWIRTVVSQIKQESPKDLYIISDSWHFDELISVHFLDNLAQSKTKLHMILPRWFEHFIFSAHAKWVNLSSKTLGEAMKRSWWMTIRWSTVALHAYEWIYITTTSINNLPISTMMKQSFENIRERWE